LSVAGGLWAIRVRLPAAQVAAAEAALEPLGVALSSFEADGGASWTVEALSESEPDRRAVQSLLKAAAMPPATIRYVPPRNWVAQSQRLLAPIRAGRFFLHGAHFRGVPPAGTLRLEIEAGLAFGTGRHETTRGCLLEFDRLAREGRRIRRPLDLGCGSGILALAMARLWAVPVLAADNDAQAVAVARDNARINGAADLVRVVKSQGFAAAPLRGQAPFDLIAANILARPLCRLAPGFARHLAPGGLAILSGLMVEQEEEVTAAQQRQGLRLARRRRLGDWSVLVFAKRAKAPAKKKRRPPSGGRRLGRR
jgi:ribosomal protein L11 methyltransferase